MKKSLFVLAIFIIIGCKELPGPDILSGTKPNGFVITEPDLAAQYTMGDTITIRWNHEPRLFEKLEIFLVLNNRQVQIIAQAIPNTGIFQLKCPEVPESINYQFLIIPIDGVYKNQRFFSKKFEIFNKDTIRRTTLYGVITTRIFSIYPDTPHLLSDYFAADAWTWNGQPGLIKSYLKFDLSSIPINNSIIAIKLYLYNHPHAEHSCPAYSDSNSSHLYRVVDPWDEQTICWNNQPKVTDLNAVEVPMSKSGTQNYILDVTEMINEMLTEGNYGIMIKLDNNSEYRRMYFASSNYPQIELRPKLVISYR